MIVEVRIVLKIEIVKDLIGLMIEIDDILQTETVTGIIVKVLIQVLTIGRIKITIGIFLKTL